MKNLYRSLFVILAWLFLAGECYAYGATATFCSGDGKFPGPGQILTGASYNTFQCGSNFNYYIVDGIQTNDNTVVYTYFLDIPVGNQLSICSIDGNETVPPGWQFIAQDSGTCAGLGGNWLIKHTSCVSEDTNCYPPPPPQISASPNPVVVPSGQTTGKVTIAWSYGLTNPTCVWYRMDDFTHHSPYPPTCGGPSGNATFTVQPGHKYDYWIGLQSGDTTDWAHTPVVNVVQGSAPTISASPAQIYLPDNKAGSTTVTWNAPGYSSTCVWVSMDGGTASSMACGGSSGTSTPNWILPGHSYKFLLYQGTTTTTLLNSATVNGLKELTASPSQVYVPQGKAGSTTITWNAPGVASACVWVSMDGGAASSMACGGSTGTSTPTWIVAGHTYNFSLYQGSTTTTLLSTVTVRGLAEMWATPNPVHIPAGATSANFTLGWNAPGYSQITVYGTNNLNQGGAIICLGSASGSGSSPEGASTGEIAHLYLVPYTGCTPGAVVTSVPSPVLATVNLTTN